MSDADLDDLLNEVESATAAPASLVDVGVGSISSRALGSSFRASSSSASAAAEPVRGGSAAGGFQGGSSSGAGEGERCTYMCLGNMSAPVGVTRSLAARVACAAQRCTACDFSVIQFRRPGGARWARDADYIFFRNDYPSEARLSARLEAAAGGVAYCCQCSWVSMLPEDGTSALCVRRPGNIVVPISIAAAEKATTSPHDIAPPVRDGRVGGQGWANWVCAGHL